LSDRSCEGQDWDVLVTERHASVIARNEALGHPLAMNTRFASIAVGLGLVSLAVLWSSSRLAHAHVQSAASPTAAALGNETISKAMKEMNGAIEALSKGVTAANKDASLEELAKFETAVLAAKAVEPSSAAKVEEKKRAAFVADYRKTLLEALKYAADAESAILDAKFKEADTLIRNKLGGLKSTGHGKFKTDGGK
jgi:hypothetical protein